MTTTRRRRAWALLLSLTLLAACDTPREAEPTNTAPEEPSPRYRNVETPAAYAGDASCTPCHEAEAAVYGLHAMARSFHQWRPESQIEPSRSDSMYSPSTGFYYAVLEVGDRLFQEEYGIGPEGKRLHELRRSIDYVMGSGVVARTYFTEENGRLFQLPLTWYSQKGWDFSPGYEINNARFDRLMPNRCIACHGSYPDPIPYMEGKYAELPPGIGCERCHGPGALHVKERSAGTPPEGTYDNTIVNPKDLPIERRLDVCDQCHVHTPVTVLREGENAFSYIPSRPLRDHIALFKIAGSIDIVSHADRLRQSACFLATRTTARAMECATCHDPHQPSPDRDAYNRTCLGCHPAATLGQMVAAEASGDHVATANCVGCHMPEVKERTVPHGTFTDHWIRVVTPQSSQPASRPNDDHPVEPYFERDRHGPEADVYWAMGDVVYATLATSPRLLNTAAKELDGALGSDTTRGDAHFLLGLAYRELGRTDDAIRALETSLRITPDRPEALHALARAYETAGREPDSVARLYRRALELQPALAWIRADYAHFLQAHVRLREAEIVYRAALAERPSLDGAAFNLGTLLAGLERLPEAAAEFQVAADLNPSLAEALASLVEIRVRGNTVTSVRLLGSPLETLPVRSRGPNAVHLAVGPGPRSAQRGVALVNMPHRALVRILEPDGTVVRTLSGQEGPLWFWDLRDERGALLPAGLYHVQVWQSEGSAAAAAPQRFSVGIVRIDIR
jgi:tetratricopeptide (TPR) repeat protein